MQRRKRRLEWRTRIHLPPDNHLPSDLPSNNHLSPLLKTMSFLRILHLLHFPQRGIVIPSLNTVPSQTHTRSTIPPLDPPTVPFRNPFTLLLTPRHIFHMLYTSPSPITMLFHQTKFQIPSLTKKTIRIPSAAAIWFETSDIESAHDREEMLPPLVPPPPSTPGAIVEQWLVAMRGVMKEHWSTAHHPVRSTHARLFYSCVRFTDRLILSNEFNSTSAVATSMSPNWRTKSSSGDAAQVSARFMSLPNHSRT